MKRMFILSAVCLAGSCIMVSFSNDLLEVRSEDHQLQYGSSLSFENVNGDLEIREWENDYARIETSIYGDSSRGIPEDLHVHITPSSGRLDCSVDYPDGMNSNSVDFLVMVPRDAALVIQSETVNGETVITAAADVFVETVNGDIFLDVNGTSGVFTTNGDIRAVLKLQDSSADIETVNGDVELTVPVSSGIVVDTVNGDIIYMGTEYEDEFEIQGSGNDVLSVETVNGDVILDHSEIEKD